MLNTIAKEFLKIYNALSRLVYVINTYFKILNKKNIYRILLDVSRIRIFMLEDINVLIVILTIVKFNFVQNDFYYY